jgi:hypothetical protein
MATPQHVPIMATLRAAVGFLRDHIGWIAPFGIGLGVLHAIASLALPSFGGAPPPAGVQLLFPVAALGSVFLLAQIEVQGAGGVGPVLGLLLISAMAVASIGYWALLLRRALGKTGSQAALGEDWARLTRVFGSVWFLVLIFTFVAAMVLASLLVGAMSSAGISEAQTQAAVDDPVLMNGLMERGMRGPGGWMVWAGGLAMLAGVAWLFARLALSGPATIAENRAMAFAAWGYTKGDGLYIAIIYTALAAPALLLAYLMVSATPPITGLSEAEARTAMEAAAPLLFAGNLVLIFVQTLIVMPLMAGAGAYLYRGLKPR